MELHAAVRELVEGHGERVLEDAAGFRGLLDDILDEDVASTGDINLLVDAVRFAALTPLVAMLDGGASAQSAVDEAGARLARDRGGEDYRSASWAVAVLAYAAGRVPEAEVLRLRSQGAAPNAADQAPTNPSGQRPQSGSTFAPPTAPSSTPPSASPPPSRWPGSEPHPGYLPPPSPASSAPRESTHARSGSWPAASSTPAPTYGGHPGYGAPGQGGPGPSAGRKRGPGLWIAIAAVLVVLVGGGVVAVVLATRGGDGGGSGGGNGDDGDDLSAVDVSAQGIESRYNSLASSIAQDAEDCVAKEPEDGESEVVECSVPAGTLALTTYESADALRAARKTSVDRRVGTLSGSAGAVTYYQFDPEISQTSDEPAVIYWDSTAGAQAARLTGADGATMVTVTQQFAATSPRATPPSTLENGQLREFADKFFDFSSCKRQSTYFEGETEESLCRPAKGISVVVGKFARYRDRAELRLTHLREWRAAAGPNRNNFWYEGDEPNPTRDDKEGNFYAYVNSAGTPVLYWDWNEPGCNCYAIGYAFDGTLDQLVNWWSE